MKTRFWSLPVLILAALALTACGSDPRKNEGAAVVSNGGAASSNGAAAQTAAATTSSGLYAAQLNNPNSALYNKVVYFDFDKSSIRSEFVDTLKAHAAFLANNPEVKVTVEGHCDERGSREYNIGLGERRSSAVLTFFTAEGVAANQVNTISYGEERPAAAGHDESAWSQNRRAVIVYEY